MESMIVKTFAVQAGPTSDEIPVTVRRGLNTVGTAKSLYELARSGSPDVLKNDITFFTIKREEIIIQVK